ncbi:MAG: DevR family CRISPR-associated autoregulator [Crenarchaeota archaeon]|nr:DevR family CRISPR-associated autoregulator [Thermoproteota archaeon]
MTGSVSLGVSFRVIVNQESLNMAESVGNVTRHRKAPIVVKIGDSYKLVYVPVVSGMSLAHHYQRHLAKAAHDMGLNVTRMSLLGYFMKFADNKIIENYYSEIYNNEENIKDIFKKLGNKKIKNKVLEEHPEYLCKIEKRIVEDCVVADVGGFLYTEGPVKRTSRFNFSYLVPTHDAIETGSVSTVPQLHVRFTPEAKAKEQLPYYNDNSSALYTATFLLEVDGISKLEVCQALSRNPGDNSESLPESLGKDEQAKRFEASVKALIAMLGNLAFGAKRSRNLPHWEIRSAVVTGAVGIAPFVPSSGHQPSFIADTVARARIQKEQGVLKDYTIAAYKREDGVDTAGANTYRTLEEAIAAVAAWIRNAYFA